MLVLSRKSRESIVIGGAGDMLREFTVTVLEIRGGRVKLGFKADPRISVQRSEVLARLRAGELPDGNTEGLRGMTVQ